MNVHEQLAKLSEDDQGFLIRAMAKHNVETNPERIVEIDYTNWRGERSIRKIMPIAMAHLTKGNEWHGPCWAIGAYDIAKDRVAEFPLASIHGWKEPNHADHHQDQEEGGGAGQGSAEGGAEVGNASGLTFHPGPNIYSKDEN